MTGGYQVYMDIRTIKDRISRNEEKLARKMATIEKKQAVLVKLNKKFESLYGCPYSEFDEGAFRNACNTSDTNIEAWSDYVDLSDKIENAEECIKNAGGVVKEIRRVTENWNKKLAEESENTTLSDIPVIRQFLDSWEETTYEWLYSRYDEYKKARDNFNQTFPKINYMEAIEKEENFNRKWGIMTRLYSSDKDRFSQNIKNYLAREKKTKYDDLVTRVESVVGNITNADYLTISPKGDLNGIIEGTKGKADVATIGAGGWNIQCFHYRTLIYRVAED